MNNANFEGKGKEGRQFAVMVNAGMGGERLVRGFGFFLPNFPFDLES